MNVDQPMTDQPAAAESRPTSPDPDDPLLNYKPYGYNWNTKQWRDRVRWFRANQVHTEICESISEW